MAEIILAQSMTLSFDANSDYGSCINKTYSGSPVEISMVGIRVRHVEPGEGSSDWGIDPEDHLLRLTGAKLYAGVKMFELDCSAVQEHVNYSVSDINSLLAHEAPEDDYSNGQSALHTNGLGRFRLSLPFWEYPRILLTDNATVGVTIDRDHRASEYSGPMSLRVDVYGYDGY
jgi:hypothetical protein